MHYLPHGPSTRPVGRVKLFNVQSGDRGSQFTRRFGYLRNPFGPLFRAGWTRE
jgi:hypothetical protein